MESSMGMDQRLVLLFFNVVLSVPTHMCVSNESNEKFS